MDKQKLIYISAFILVLYFAFHIVSNVIEGEEGKIKRLMQKARGAVEKEDLIFLATIISRDYVDEHGNSREGVLFIVRGVFREYEKISVGIKTINVELNEPNAIVEIEALILAKADRKISTAQKQAEYDIIKLKVHLVKQESGWKIVKLDFLERPQYMFLHAA